LADDRRLVPDGVQLSGKEESVMKNDAETLIIWVALATIAAVPAVAVLIHWVGFHR
jgi:hypothetical protein